MPKLTAAETDAGRLTGKPARTLDRRIQAFSMFPPDVAKKFCHAAVHRCWSNGSIVLPEGRVVPWVMTLVRGRLRMAATLDDGRDVFFRWHVPGETAGLISAVSELPFPVDAVAFDDCETLHVDREMLLAMMRADGNVALAVARLVAKHAYDTVNLVRMRTESTLNARVLGVLRHLALVNGSPHGPAAWELSVSQRDIAGAVGASRQRVNTELRLLEQAGHIQLGYNRILVIGSSWVGPPMLPPKKR
jgi:CRP/FNR family transcriptional regulator, cyclic AMP receptor protein